MKIPIIEGSIYARVRDCFRYFTNQSLLTQKSAPQGLVYHAHLRPLTTPAATLLDLSAAIHKRVPRSIPTPSSLLRSLGSIHSTSSPLESMANMLTIPPIHVDHVAEAICVAFESQDVRGIVGVRRMRELIGWPIEGQVDDR